jgi:hypothetical protein
MTPNQRTVRRLYEKVAGSLRLLRHDPETLARNLMQFSHPALFEQRLIDVLHAVPMHVRYSPASDAPPRLNVLDSAWTRSGMTGGPNTVINLAARIAKTGIEVRLVSTVRPNTIDLDWFKNHMSALAGDVGPVAVSLASAGEVERPLELGPRDCFLATHWTTAQQLRHVLPMMPIRTFFYMLQEYEPAFYPWSSNHALALETFSMDFCPIVNEALLADFLFKQPFGRLAEPAIKNSAIVFEPAVDAALFQPAGKDAGGRPKRLLFYARPNNTRNLFGIGLMALRQIAASSEFAGWEFLSIGGRGSVPDMALGGGAVLRNAPWLDYAGYAGLLGQADLLLCPMLSPHTSYPVLEMAACGGLSVTNVFMGKTKEALEALSCNIIAVEATVDGFAEGLSKAAQTINRGGPRVGSLNMPREWGAALDPAARQVAGIFHAWQDGAQT